MNLDNLNQDEVLEIINRLKYPKNIFTFNKIYSIVSSLFGKIDIDENVLDDEDLQYIFRVYRGEMNPNRFSIHLRFKNLPHHLVRVDINPSNKHTNPDGTIISGSHIHIYSTQHSKKDRIAISLEKSNFPNITTINDAVIHFLEYTNIDSKRHNR